MSRGLLRTLLNLSLFSFNNIKLPVRQQKRYNAKGLNSKHPHLPAASQHRMNSSGSVMRQWVQLSPRNRTTPQWSFGIPISGIRGNYAVKSGIVGKSTRPDMIGHDSYRNSSSFRGEHGTVRQTDPTPVWGARWGVISLAPLLCEALVGEWFHRRILSKISI